MPRTVRMTDLAPDAGDPQVDGTVERRGRSLPGGRGRVNQSAKDLRTVSCRGLSFRVSAPRKQIGGEPIENGSFDWVVMPDEGAAMADIHSRASGTEQRMIVYGGDYEHTLEVSSSLHDFCFEYRIAGRPELYAKVLQRQDFDACEFSLSNYIMLRDRGVDWVTAIPVFPSRAFRHGTIMVRRESDISDFADLAGCRVGISDYTMTGGVWCRGIVFEQYGMHWSEMEWLSAEVPRFQAPSAARVTVSQIDLEEALAKGVIDALILPRSRDALLPASRRRFRPLLKDWRNAELGYYRSTQIYPISHVIVMPRDRVLRHPRLPGALFAAYSQSMVRAKRRRLATSFLPWGAEVWDETMELFAGDPVPYDLGALNLKTVNKLQDYLIEQQLIERRHGTDDLFEPVDLSRTSSAA